MEDNVNRRLEWTNLHDKEENKNDKDADIRVKPHSRATETRREGRTPYFSPGEVIKQRVDALPGHQLRNNTVKFTFKPNQIKYFKDSSIILRLSE